MNEKFKQLAEQADKWFEEDGHSYSRPAWNEKFAELIVKECVKTGKELYDECKPWGDIEELYNHFGVEE